MIPLVPGRVVCSKAGRDAKRMFIILQALDERHVTIADGDLRKVASPKKKKYMHLIPKQECFPSLVEMYQTGRLLDADVRNCLARVRLTRKEG